MPTMGVVWNCLFCDFPAASSHPLVQCRVADHVATCGGVVSAGKRTDVGAVIHTREKWSPS